MDAPPALGGKWRHRVVNVRIRLLDWVGRTVEEGRKEREKEAREWEERRIEEGKNWLEGL